MREKRKVDSAVKAGLSRHSNMPYSYFSTVGLFL